MRVCCGKLKQGIENLGRIITIGDIHGRFSKLPGLLDKISSGAEDQMIFLGDYIDKDQESFRVVEYTIEFKQRFLSYSLQFSQT